MEYTKQEYEEIIRYVENTFGKIDGYFDKIEFAGGEMLIAVIPPTPEKNMTTFVTIGVGQNMVSNLCHSSDAPYIELVVSAPADAEERWSDYTWIFDEMVYLSSLPFFYYLPYSWGHLNSNHWYYSEETKLSGNVLIYPEMDPENKGSLKIDSRTLQFFQVVFLYDEEYQYALKHGTESLFALDKNHDITSVVDLKRPSIIKATKETALDQRDIIDRGDEHLRDYRYKGIEVDEINVYNHMAIFLRWAYEKGLLDDGFVEKYKKYLEECSYDLRSFIRDCLDGNLRKSYFNSVGREFVHGYYNNSWFTEAREDILPFPAAIDLHTYQVFGEERAESAEFKHEAYLYVPFDQQYYEDMKVYMEKAYKDWFDRVISEKNN